jgi:hypothetical protein
MQVRYRRAVSSRFCGERGDAPTPEPDVLSLGAATQHDILSAITPSQTSDQHPAAEFRRMSLRGVIATTLHRFFPGCGEVMEKGCAGVWHCGEI